MEKKDSSLSAYEKAAQLGIDPRCIPQHLPDVPPVGADIPYPSYSLGEVETWNLLFKRQMSLLEGRVCEEYIHGVNLMGFDSDRIPALSQLSATLESVTGWKVARVPGLIHEKDFFDLLRQRIFPSTDYIREKHELDYTPAPDMFHDIFGHMPLLTNPAFADFYQKFGAAALRAENEQHIMLERLHWFTVEFGLIRKPSGMRIYGAGIVSSLNEVEHSLSDKVEVHNFDPIRVTRQEYEVWHLQPLLFAIDSFEALESAFDQWASSQSLV